MKRIFSKEFLNTPLLDLSASDRKIAVLLLLGIFFFCVVIAGVAAWHLIY